eukprot:TRINITY_DN3702_c0_g1_i1.p1 TRINITY_DN3702_c0_g1~~TRINITY_DN3702_c0_g1_i1.p1  ORF type:complete len:583 (-),score=217.16 TRINITY_DN3702_c0_g1_i1:141-1889(-)
MEHSDYKEPLLSNQYQENEQLPSINIELNTLSSTNSPTTTFEIKKTLADQTTEIYATADERGAAPVSLNKFTISREDDIKKSFRWIPSYVDILEWWAVNGLQFALTTIWILVNIALGVEAASRYWNKPNFYITVARAFGQLLNFNCALILVPVLRNVLTLLRKTFLHDFLPWDSNLTFHRYIAFWIAICVAIHGIAHYLNIHEKSIEPDSNNVFHSEWYYSWNNVYVITGNLLIFVILFMFSPAQRVIKRSHFNLFYLTHHLFIVFYALLLIHGKNFWKWFLAPAVIYMIERIIREYRGHKKIRVLDVKSHPSDVLEVHFSKQKSFKFSAGQYLFLSCPLISSYEWHPFTITAAPQDDYLSCHIRCVGPWTKGLRNVLSPNSDGSETAIDSIVGADGKRLLRVDGPYGSATEDVFKFQTVMLIGAGIGVTPFASILKSVRNILKSRDEQKLKKVYFFWICREYKAFEWFKDLLKEMEITSKEHGNFLEINIFLTGTMSVEQIRKIVNSNTGRDYITDFETLTNFGRPKWDAIFSTIANSHTKQEIGVFYCGPPELAKKIRQQAVDSTQKEKVARFLFHKENF